MCSLSDYLCLRKKGRGAKIVLGEEREKKRKKKLTLFFLN